MFCKRLNIQESKMSDEEAHMDEYDGVGDCYERDFHDTSWSGSYYEPPHHHNYHDNRQYNTRHRYNSGSEIGDKATTGPKQHMHQDDAMVRGRTRTIDIVARIEGSYNDFATNKALTVWRPTSDGIQRMLLNSKTINRINAAKEDLSGNPSKVVILGMIDGQSANNFDKNVDIQITDCEPRVMTGGGTCARTMEAGHTSPGTGEDFFAPDKKMSYEDAAHFDKFDMKRINDEIRFNPVKNVANVAVGGVVWNHIKSEVDNNRWPGQADLIYEQDYDDVKWATVSTEIANDVTKDFKRESEKSKQYYTDMNNFKITFSPANGEAWDDLPVPANESIIVSSDSLYKPRRGFYKITMIYCMAHK